MRNTLHADDGYTLRAGGNTLHGRDVSPNSVERSRAKLVIPAGLPDAQTLILVEKPSNGGVMTKEILPVRFSQLEGAEAA
jgi:hypothetical protein